MITVIFTHVNHRILQRPYSEVIKLFMLNSAEHEIKTAPKYSNSLNQWNFLV